MQLLTAALSTLSILSTLGCALFLAYLTSTERKAPKCSDSVAKLKRSDQKHSLTVIITAKNEEDTISRCIDSLISQTCSDFKILVVDDSSSDNTRQVVQEYASKSPRIALIEAGPKPEGWVGKSWPCWRGYESSDSEFLLFADADSWFEKGTIGLALDYVVAEEIDVFSISPRVKLNGIWARAVVPIITAAINLLYPMIKVNDKKSDRAYVFGTFILLKKETYETIGGHRAVRQEIVEDAAIGKLAKNSGKKLRVEIGTGYLSTEWENRPSAIYDGLERVASTSIKEYGLVSILNAVLLFFVGLYPLIFSVACIVLLLSGDLGPILSTGLVAGLLGILSFLLISYGELRLIRESVGLAPLLYPIGVAFFVSAVVSTSIKVTYGRKIGWKGEKYAQESK